MDPHKHDAPPEAPPTYTAFAGTRRLARGNLAEVTRAVALAQTPSSPGDAAVLVFDDRSGRVHDLDLRPSSASTLEPTSVPAAGAPEAQAEAASPAAPPRGRGRPRLGVVAREVTLLPRHWDWLAEQPGGASVALRKLVEEARRTQAEPQRRRARQERTYRFLHALAGDLPGYEEVLRALYADRLPDFEVGMQAWPEDVREHALWLARAE